MTGFFFFVVLFVVFVVIFFLLLRDSALIKKLKVIQLHSLLIGCLSVNSPQVCVECGELKRLPPIKSVLQVQTNVINL